MSFQKLQNKHESKSTIRLHKKLFWSQDAHSGQERKLLSQVSLCFFICKQNLYNQSLTGDLAESVKIRKLILPYKEIFKK